MPRLARLVIFGLISLLAFGASVRLFTTADSVSAVRRQLAFLRSELEEHAAEKAQSQFPEGYFFLYALYGLTAVDLGLAGDHPDVSRREAQWALAALDSDAGRAPFDAQQSPAYGAFYRGWTNWLRGGVLALQGTKDPRLLARFEDDSAAIARAFEQSPTPYLTSYTGQAWPVDSTVAAASLALHDHLLTPKYGATLRRWTTQVRAHLDPATGLLPHTADPTTGAPTPDAPTSGPPTSGAPTSGAPTAGAPTSGAPTSSGTSSSGTTSGARGSSQSIVQRFLPEIDPAFAREQYTRFRTQFLTTPLGIGPAIREYPRGTDGPADVDSGPLPLGISFSATVVTIGAAKVHGDASLADGLSGVGEVAGVPIGTWHTRRYAFGLLPIGDAFLAWSKSARPWVAATPAVPERAVSRWWRVPLLVVFATVGAAPWLVHHIRRRAHRHAHRTPHRRTRPGRTHRSPASGSPT